MNDITIDKTGWKKWRFDEVCRQVNASTKDPEADGLHYVIGLEHIEPGNLHITKWDTLEKETTFTRKFVKGQVLFGRRRAYQRKVAYAEFDGICSGDILVFEAVEENLLPELLPFLIQSDGFFEKALATSAGSLSPRTKFKELADYEFFLPPKSEQKRLAELLWAADEMIEKEKKELEKINEFKKYFISSNLLNGNKCISLKDLGTLIRGVSYKPEQVREKYDSDAFILLRSNNIDSNFRVNYNEVYYIDSVILKEDQNLCLNDIVICMSNGSKDLVGKAAEITSLNKERISVGSFCAIYRPNNAIAKYLFQSSEYRKQIALLLSGSNINNLKPADIESVKFRIQEREDLKEFILYLEHIDKTTGKIFLQLRASQQFKQELINKIF